MYHLVKRRPVTLHAIPSVRRLIRLKKKAYRNGTHVRLYLREDRDGVDFSDMKFRALRMAPYCDQIAVRMNNGSLKILKNRYETWGNEHYARYDSDHLSEQFKKKGVTVQRNHEGYALHPVIPVIYKSLARHWTPEVASKMTAEAK